MDPTTAPAESRSASFVRRIPLWSILGTGAAILVSVVVLSLWLTSTTNTATDTASVANGHSAAIQSQAAPLAGQVASVCGQGNAAATQLARSGACKQAQKVISVVQEPVPGPTGERGPGPSDAQVQAFVDGYFATHPLPAGQLPPVSEVAGLVASYCTAHRGCGAGDVATQVSSYCAAHDGCGTEDVASAVATYCDTHNQCAGPQGVAGSNGTDGTAGTDGSDGKDGASGAAGPPVAGWVYVDALGMSHTCTPAPPPDGQSAPWYSCD
jgi:hypothetical protein